MSQPLTEGQRIERAIGVLSWAEGMLAVMEQSPLDAEELAATIAVGHGPGEDESRQWRADLLAEREIIDQLRARLAALSAELGKQILRCMEPAERDAFLADYGFGQGAPDRPRGDDVLPE